MGCDIHSRIEVYDREEDHWKLYEGELIPADDIEKKIYGVDWMNEPFRDRNYEVFAWLAGVRNYSGITPLSEPRDVPSDLSPEVARYIEEWGINGHSHSWFSLEELLAVDYDQTIEDRRYEGQIGPNMWSGALTAPVGKGVKTTLRKFLGTQFMEDLERLKGLGDVYNVRIVFFFDN